MLFKLYIIIWFKFIWNISKEVFLLKIDYSMETIVHTYEHNVHRENSDVLI